MLALSACASNNTGKTSQSYADGKVIRVIGTGRTKDEAKDNGFQSAIEIAVGSVVLSDAEMRNNRLVRDDIRKHSAGYVDDYKIISQDNHRGDVSLVMDVNVKHSRIAERLLDKGGSSGTVQGDKISTQYKSYLNERSTGDRLVNSILSDFPSNALLISQAPTQMKLDTQRNAVITVPYEIRWSKKYLTALNEVFKVLEDGPEQHNLNMACMCYLSPSRFTVISKEDGAWTGTRSTYHFNDEVRASQIKESLNRNIMIHARIRGIRGEELHHSCFFSTQTFRGTHPTGVYVVWGNDIEKRFIEIRVEPESALARNLQFADKVELTIEDHGC
jgi:hypothetical protein